MKPKKRIMRLHADMLEFVATDLSKYRLNPGAEWDTLAALCRVLLTVADELRKLSERR